MSQFAYSPYIANKLPDNSSIYRFQHCSGHAMRRRKPAREKSNFIAGFMKRQQHAASQSLCEARDAGRMNHQVQPYSTRAIRQSRSQLSSAQPCHLNFHPRMPRYQGCRQLSILSGICYAFNVVVLKTRYQVTLPPSHRRRHSNCASIMHQSTTPGRNR